MRIRSSPYHIATKRFNLARPRWWVEIFALALGSIELAFFFLTDFKLDYVLIALPVNALVFLGGYLIWRPLNYLITEPDKIVIRTWSFSGTNHDRREIPYDVVQDMGADEGNGTLWLRYAPSRRLEDGTFDPGGMITVRISPSAKTGVAAKLIEERRNRVSTYLDGLDARINAARAEGGRLLSEPSPDALADEHAE